MAQAITAENLKNALADCGIPNDARVAVALSGGPDSLALAVLVSGLRDTVCLTVDHGLRTDSAHEAATVAARMNTLGIAHHILPWEGAKPTANIQAEAREARYALMAGWCRSNGVQYLLTAHHRDDQAETLLLRLARGSGVYGLAAMAPVVPLGDDVTLVRPCLGFSKASLVAFLETRELPFVQDPSNQADRFDRVKIRKFLEKPPLDGFTPVRLAETAARLRRTRDALEYYEHEWLSRSVKQNPDGSIILNVAALQSAPEEIVLRGLASCCRIISGQGYVPRMEKLERAALAMQAPDFQGQTLYGVQMQGADGGSILMFRELAAVEGRIRVKDGACWDNRFDISAGDDIAGLEIGALGLEGWAEAVKLWPELRSSEMPFAARLVLPALFVDGQIRAIPHMRAEFGPKLDVSLSLKSLGWPKK